MTPVTAESSQRQSSNLNESLKFKSQEFSKYNSEESINELGNDKNNEQNEQNNGQNNELDNDTDSETITIRRIYEGNEKLREYLEYHDRVKRFERELKRCVGKTSIMVIWDLLHPEDYNTDYIILDKILESMRFIEQKLEKLQLGSNLRTYSKLNKIVNILESTYHRLVLLGIYDSSPRKFFINLDKYYYANLLHYDDIRYMICQISSSDISFDYYFKLLKYLKKDDIHESFKLMKLYERDEIELLNYVKELELVDKLIICSCSNPTFIGIVMDDVKDYVTKETLEEEVENVRKYISTFGYSLLLDAIN